MSKNMPINQLSDIDLNQLFYESTGVDGFGKNFVMNFEGFAFKFVGHTNTKDNRQSIFMIPIIDGDDIKPRICLRDNNKTIIEQCLDLLKLYTNGDQFKKFKSILSNNSLPPAKQK